MILLFAGMAVGFALGFVVAALLAASGPAPDCDGCVLAQGSREGRLEPAAGAVATGPGHAPV
ncbi:MAG: hypothetical protein D6739_06810 [Nitrospirae bacterium]|nr:MAG: hypothetical protein D6739_06810 [Nitrospirota bacterium]